MGILSFLSGKRAPERSLADVKTQAYDGTAVARPPVRGTYPIAGNGVKIPNIPAELQPRLGSSRAANPIAPPPPPSSAGELRHEPVGRPNTAPSAQSSPQSSPPRDDVFRARARVQLISVTSPRVSSISSPRPSQDKPTSRARPLYSRESVATVRTGDAGVNRGYVDLLDAHSAIKPFNFHQRVKATGARDYGEDVADRNVGQNGVNVDSNAARAFYASNQESPESELEANDDDFNRRESRFSQVTVLYEGRPTRSLSSTSHNSPYPHRPASYYGSSPAIVGSEARALRRQSTPLALRRDSLRNEDFAYGDEYDVNLPADVAERARRNSRLREPVRPPQSRTRSLTSQYRQETPDYETTSVMEPVRMMKQLSRRSQVASSSASQPSTAKSSTNTVHLPLTRHETIGEPSVTRQNWRNLEDSAEQQRSASYSHSKSPHQRLRGNDEIDSPYARSNISSSGRANTRQDSEEPYAENTPSLRRWSLASTAASIQSSNPFRPQSQHTNNTSVDLAPFTSSKSMNSSQNSLASSSPRTIPPHSHSRGPSNLTGPPLSPPAESALEHPRQDENFNIDDYVSSDECYDTPRRSRNHDENVLLFDDSGYGAGEGLCLPGLSDSASPIFKPTPLSAYGNKPFASYPGNPNEVPIPGISPSYPPSLGEDRDQGNKFSMPSFDHGDSDDDDDDSFLNSEFEEDSDNAMYCDIPMSRGAAPAPRYHRDRYNGSQAAILDEDLDRMSLNAAMRLRKEARRATDAVPRRGMTKGKGRETARLRPIGVDIADSDAYVED